jgi:hypothetical protein
MRKRGEHNYKKDFSIRVTYDPITKQKRVDFRPVGLIFTDGERPGSVSDPWA